MFKNSIFKFWRVGALLAGLLTVFNVSAVQRSECLQYNPADHNQDRYISYIYLGDGHNHRCLTNGEWAPESSNPYFSDIYGALLRTTGLRNELDNKLTDMARGELQSAVAGKASLKSVDVKINGTIRLTLQGQPDSKSDVHLILDGFDIYGYAKVTKSWYASGSAKITANNVRLTAKYNVLTGKVTAVVPDNLHVNTDIDLSSPLSFLFPPLFAAFEIIENKLEGKLESTIKSQIASTASAYEKTIFSLDEAIPNGEIVNGKDIGMLVKDQLVHHVKNVSISISQSGKSTSDAWATVKLQNLEVTFGRKFYKTKYDCPNCNLP